nr:MAG: protein m31 [Herpesviridae sp.]
MATDEAKIAAQTLSTPSNNINEPEELIYELPTTSDADLRYQDVTVEEMTVTEPLTINLADIADDNEPLSDTSRIRLDRNIPAPRNVSVIVPRRPEIQIFSSNLDSADTTWFDLLRYANFLDATRKGATLRNPYFSRRHLSVYRSNLERMIRYYNVSVPQALEARLHEGFIYLQAPLSYGTDTPTDIRERRWINILIPKLVNMIDMYLLTCSPESSQIICAPFITKGGIVTISAIPARTCTTAPLTDPNFTQLILVPFVPSPIPQHGVKIFATHPSFPIDFPKMGHLSLTKKSDTSFIGLIQHLVWTRHVSAINGTSCRHVTYSAWFNGVFNTTNTDIAAWRSYGNVIYQLPEQDISINIESMYVNSEKTHIIGSLSLGVRHCIESELNPKLLPQSTSIFFDLLPSYRRPTLLFDVNPKLFFTGQALDTNPQLLNEPNIYEITVYAPYDIRMDFAAHVVKIDVKYQHAHGRQFLVSGVPGNDHFYTGFSIWYPETHLKIYLWSSLPDMVIFRGTPIATLYLTHAIEGATHEHTDRAVIRLLSNNRKELRLHLGHMHLPSENFPCYDELINHTAQ